MGAALSREKTYIFIKGVESTTFGKLFSGNKPINAFVYIEQADNDN